MNKIDNTLQYYNDNAAAYAEQTVQTDMSGVLGRFLDGIPYGGSILDLGCGSGRDSKSFLEKGYSVAAIDGSPELCEIASKYIGSPVRCLLFQDLDYDKAFDGIWACSSLHHLTRGQLSETLPRVIRALKPGGRLYTCFKYGEEDFDDEKGRHFTRATEQTVYELFEAVNDYGDLTEGMEVWISGDNLGGRELQWVNVIVTR